jgi:hypothetical protein
MLFDVRQDPHELHDLARARPDLVGAGMARLEQWTADQLSRSPRDVDPMWTVIREGGPYHANFSSAAYGTYLDRLRSTGREWAVAELEQRRRRVGR